jgi:hypothetical protein
LHPWIEHCRERALPLKLVHCTDSTIISQLANVDALLWQPWQLRSEDMLMAHCLVMALGAAGKVVYPNTSTLLALRRQVGAEIPSRGHWSAVGGDSRVFDAKTAIDWIERTAFPKCLSCVGCRLIQCQSCAQCLGSKEASPDSIWSRVSAGTLRLHRCRHQVPTASERS